MDLKRKRIGVYEKVTSGSEQQLVVGYCKHSKLPLCPKMSIISWVTEWLLVHQDRLYYLNWSDEILTNIIPQNCLAHSMMNWNILVCSGRVLWVMCTYHPTFYLRKERDTLSKNVYFFCIFLILKMGTIQKPSTPKCKIPLSES